MVKKIGLYSTCILLMFLVLWLVGKVIYRWEQKKELGELLGVNSSQYSESFPIDYFRSTLSTKSKINEIHEIIIGYEKVYHCGDYEEFYLYYDADVDRALRFTINYDKDKEMEFIAMQYTDQNSGYPPIKNCQEGLLK